jgi:ferredoxin
MQEYIKNIQERARDLLAKGKVDLVIGYQKGSVPMMHEPVGVRRPEEAAKLFWDDFCGVNLANYLPKRRERIAILAKGCDSRNLVIHLQENQIKREQLVILGIPCQGMVDRRKILKALNGREPLGVEVNGEKVLCRGKEFEETFDRNPCLQDNCAICLNRNPVIYDELLGEPVPEQTGVDRFADVRRVEAMSPSERWDYFSELLKPCIRCYACRNVCPLCYCPTCFVDESRPQWMGKTIDPTDVRTFHFLRAFHCAGRCTDCGACERACPVGIPVRQFTKKLEKDVFELYGFEAGLVLEGRPPLDAFRPDDPESFIF